MDEQFGYELVIADQTVKEAFEEDEPQRRVERARQALALWPDCADAYVLLAENARSRKQALRLYEQGMAAGERSLGPAVFREEAGHFWGLLETRPYLRARLRLRYIPLDRGHARTGCYRHRQP